MKFNSYDLVNLFISKHGFPLVSLDLPEMKSENYEIKTEVLEKGAEVKIVSARIAIMTHQPILKMKMKLESSMVVHKLIYKVSNVMISTVPEEIYTQLYPSIAFRGNILVAGLGLGLIIAILRQNPYIKNITVVEVDKELIDLVKPYYENVNIIHADIRDVLTLLSKEVKKQYDNIYLDTWYGTGEHVLYTEVLPLRKMALKCVDRDSLYCWMEEVMRRYVMDAIKFRIEAYKQEELTEEQCTSNWSQNPDSALIVRRFFADHDLRHLRLVKPYKLDKLIKKYVLEFEL